MEFTFERYLNWYDHVTAFTSSAVKKHGFLFRASKYLSPVNLYTSYVSQVRPILKYFSGIWRYAPSTTLRQLNVVQQKAIKAIGDPVLSSKLLSRAHRRAVGRYFHGSIPFAVDFNFLY